jgi:hypothetical protein
MRRHPDDSLGLGALLGGENPAVGAELCTCAAGAKAKAHAKQNAAGAEDAEDRGERKIGAY